MDGNVESKQNEAMLGLFKIGARMDVGIPAWLIDEVDHYRPTESSPEVTSGADGKNGLAAVLNSCYADKGYVFSWGILSETRSEDDGCVAEENSYVDFEFCIKDLLIALPNSAMLEDLVSWMYTNHPLANSEFETDESMGDWTMLMFTARGAKEISHMRRWLAKVFIPLVLPDLLREGMKIVKAAKAEVVQHGRNDTVNELLIEHERFQLCGDPKDLSF